MARSREGKLNLRDSYGTLTNANHEKASLSDLSGLDVGDSNTMSTADHSEPCRIDHDQPAPSEMVKDLFVVDRWCHQYKRVLHMDTRPYGS